MSDADTEALTRPGPRPEPLQRAFHLGLSATHQHYPHFTGEEMGARRDAAQGPTADLQLGQNKQQVIIANAYMA